jgi:hypothetical protein
MQSIDVHITNASYSDPSLRVTAIGLKALNKAPAISGGAESDVYRAEDYNGPIHEAIVRPLLL